MATRKAAKLTFVVTRSFNGFNEGDRLTSERDAWTKAHEAAGLLREVEGGEGTDQAREG